MIAAATVSNAADIAWKAMNPGSTWMLESLATKRTIVEQVDDLLRQVDAGEKAEAILDKLREVLNAELPAAKNRDDASDDLLTGLRLMLLWHDALRRDGMIGDHVPSPHGIDDARDAIARATSQPETAKR